MLILLQLFQRIEMLYKISMVALKHDDLDVKLVRADDTWLSGNGNIDPLPKIWKVFVEYSLLIY